MAFNVSVLSPQAQMKLGESFFKAISKLQYP
jgi:hypothetical protein